MKGEDKEKEEISREKIDRVIGKLKEEKTARRDCK